MADGKKPEKAPRPASGGGAQLRPDAFRMQRFRLDQKTRRNMKRDSRVALNAVGMSALPVMGFRLFRPAWRVDVETSRGKPTRISAPVRPASIRIYGQVSCAAGPWRASGDWWQADVWARDEWDVAVSDSSNGSEMLCRIYRDLTNEQWFVAGIYD